MNEISLAGKAVSLLEREGPLAPCRYCGHKAARITEGKGPHLAGLRCLECGRHLGWLSRAMVQYMEARHGLNA